ncbi:hypothetical protein WA026_023784 [Henosepilachna vigintioctopunctata]|uniref:Uncharacterized protein n=1 Tax=Henosepilachna vigintioctopunctata TaxID=420089 RepID=A0AAW1UXV0_9CUCU
MNKENATRVSKTSYSVIQHALTNKNLNCKIDLYDHRISDHRIMSVKINEQLKTSERKKINIPKINVERWIQSVENKLQQSDVQSFEELTYIITGTKTSCTTHHTIKTRTNNNWITHEYLELLKICDKQYVRWKKVLNEQTEMDFKKIKNKVNNLRSKLKKHYAEKKFLEAKGNNKKTWDV